MKTLKPLAKSVLPVVVTMIAFFALISSVGATIDGGSDLSSASNAHLDPAIASAVVGGTDIDISADGAGSPDIAASSDGTFIAVTYYRNSTSEGGIHLKSATAASGWLTSKYLGTGTKPHLAFGLGGEISVVYVVWVSGDNKAIKYARCTLSATVVPTCTTGDVTTSLTSSLDDPDVIVDGTGGIHVAWTDNGNVVTARSAPGATPVWAIFPPLNSGGDNFRRPLLAAGSSVLHLAYVRENTSNLGLKIEYYRTTNLTNHSWANFQDYGPGDGLTAGGYDRVNNPALTASGNSVYLAWEAHSPNLTGEGFGLMRVESTTAGISWSPTVQHITSNTDAASQVDLRLSRASENGSVVPIQEEGLRASMTISGSNYAVVWQQRPADTCDPKTNQNKSSEVHLAFDNAAWKTDTFSDDPRQYSIDPAIVIDVNNNRHVVFMKDADQVAGCLGADAAAYEIYYRGPFTIVANDGGEDPTDPTSSDRPIVYLPIVVKP